MKKLTLLALVAILLSSTTGCGRSWRSWWNRGAECNSYEGYSPCDSSMSFGHGALMPPISGAPILPGPIENLPSP